MSECVVCGATERWLVPPGSCKCVDCMSDWEIEQVQLGLVAAELDAEIAEMERGMELPGRLRIGDQDETRSTGEAAC